MTASPGQLEATRVDIWYVRVDAIDQAGLDRCRQLLDTEELARANRFIFDRDRALFTAAHALLRRSLSRYGQLPPTAWRFEKNRYGRPELITEQNAHRLRFNLTHTRGLAACAITHQHDLGIDAESIGRRDVSEAVARRFFAEPEVAALRQVADSERHKAFLNYWTLKESYIKARGVGMAIPLSQFWFTPPAEPAVRIAFSSRIDDRAEDWHFHRFNLDDQFLLAIAVRVRDIAEAVHVHLAEDFDVCSIS